MTWLWAIVLKPFFLFGYLCLVAFAEISVKKLLPNCWLKRLLLRRW
jgi:hypothetical protein